MKDFISLNFHSMPQHSAMHYRASADARMDKMASNEGKDSWGYYVLLGASFDKKTPLNLCLEERVSVFTRYGDSKDASIALRREKGMSPRSGMSLDLAFEDFLPRDAKSSCGVHSALFCFHLGRSIIPYEQATTSRFESFAKAWAFGVLLSYSWEAYYLLCASLQPGEEREDFAMGFRWGGGEASLRRLPDSPRGEADPSHHAGEDFHRTRSTTSS